MKKIILFVLTVLNYGIETGAQLNNSNADENNAVNIPAKTGMYALTVKNKLPGTKSFTATDVNNDYLTKSRNQKMAAWILLGGGVVGVGIGSVIEFNNAPKNLVSIITDQTYNSSGIAVAFIGGGMAVASIPLFIASSRNKKKAKLSISSQPTGFAVPTNMGSGITGITVSFPIGK